MNFRPCEQCNACCSGQLAGEVYGIPFGNGKPCAFLVRGKCSIYDDRPEMCRKYQCAWSQHLFPPPERPDKNGIMVSVERNEAKQYLKFIPIRPDVSVESVQRLQHYAQQLGADVVGIPYVERK